MAVSLTYLEIHQIAVNFDRTHQGASPTDLDYRTINFHKTKAEELNQYVIGQYFPSKLPTNPLVSALLDLYKGTAVPHRDPVLFNLNAASQAILTKLNKNNPDSGEELGYFEQLLDLVFQDYFLSLSPEERIEMARRWEKVPNLVPRLEEIAKRQNLNLKINGLIGLRDDFIRLYNDDPYMSLLKFSQHLEKLNNGTWSGCAERCRLGENMGILMALVCIGGWIGLVFDSQNTWRWSGLYLGGCLLIGLYELLLKYIPGAVLYGYRLYYKINAQERTELHRSMDQFIEVQKTKVICHSPSPGLIEKWRNRVVEIIVPPPQ
jgi:hypothetical protein